MSRRPRSPVFLLVASSGGHLLELQRVTSGFAGHERCWVTFDKPDARVLLADEPTIFARHPTNRNLPNLLHNTVLALRVVMRLRPRAIVTTGAGVAVPFCYAGWLSGARVVYVESLARSRSLSLSGRMIYPIAHSFFVQWPELARRHRRASYSGAIFDPA